MQQPLFERKPLSLVERLLEDYNEYRFQTASIQKKRLEVPYMRGLKLTAERAALLGRMIRWCEERKLDPRLWLYSLFRSRKWMYPPKFDESNLMTENPKMIRAYHTIKGLGVFRREMVERRRLQKPVWDPNRDLNNTVEVYKQRYVEQGRAMECMAQMVETTLGYHPLSNACTICPIWQKCRDKLGEFAEFDIQALRRGEITAEMAQAQVRGRWK